MTNATTTRRKARWISDGGVAEERRGERRAAVALQVVYAVEGGPDLEGRTVDVSAVSAAIQPRDGLDPAPGSRIRARIESLGMFEGRVTRTKDASFVVTFEGSETSRGRTAARIEALVADASNVVDENRKHERIVPLRRFAELATADGLRMVRVKDVSRSGIAIATDARRAVGEAVRIGSRDAKVVRLTPDGFAALFEREVAASEFGHSLIL